MKKPLEIASLMQNGNFPWEVKMTLRIPEIDCVVVSIILYFPPYLGKIPIFTNIFQMG